MTNNTGKTGFDAFFSVITNSPEFKSAFGNNKNTDLFSGQDVLMAAKEAELEYFSKNNNHGNDNPSNNNNKTGNDSNNTSHQNVNTGNSNNDKVSTPIQVQYFENKNSQTFGFNGVAGMNDLKNELIDNFIRPLQLKFFIQKLKEENKDKEILDEKTKMYVDLYEKYEKFGVGIPTGIMLYGPPGTGKTFITKKLAEELGAGLIVKSVGEFGSSYMHQTSKNIRDFFAQAKSLSNKEPIILFLDEIDSLVSKRTDKVDSNKAEEISQFLQEINALKEAPNLILVGATNRPDHLDSAIMRSGRFDKKVYLGPPDFEARKELFKIFIEKSQRPHDTLDYDELSTLTDGYVSSDIQAICEEASRDASNSILDLMQVLQDDLKNHNFKKLKKDIDKNVINMELMKQAIKDIPSSLKLVDMSIYENWLKNLD